MATKHKLAGERVNNPSKQQIRRIVGKSHTASNWKGMRPGYLYTVVRAISARVNQNYDGWPSDELKQSAHTFVGKPVFVNHENYDPEKARGVVVASRYVENGKDKYIETVMEIDAKRFPKLAHEIRTGGLDSVSMGAEAGFTICSYCGNKAQDVPDMCDHVLFHKGEKLSRFNRRTGKREEVLVYESCHKLSFFELSYVFDPADETAVASKVVMAASGVGTGPGKVMRDPKWNRPRNKSVNDNKRRWKAEPEIGDSPDADLSEPDPFDPRSYQAQVLKAAGMHTAADCPPGKDCTIHPQSEQITPDSANNPLNQGGGSSGAAAPSSGGAGASAGSDLGKPEAQGGASVADGGAVKGLLPGAQSLKDRYLKENPSADIGGFNPVVDQPWDEHATGKAIDYMHPANPDQVKQEAFDNGANYVLWQQKQWNPDGTTSPMPDRGSPTENHMDHMHINVGFRQAVLRTAGFKTAEYIENPDNSAPTEYLNMFYDENLPDAHKKVPPHWMDLMYANKVLATAGFKTAAIPGFVPMEGADPLDPSKPVFVHTNRHAVNAMKKGEQRNDVWSIKQGDHVRGYAPEVHLANNKMIVQQAGSQKFKDTAGPEGQGGQRVVHAGVAGYLASPPEQPLPYSMMDYHPGFHSSFVHRDNGEPVYSADHVHFTPDAKMYGAQADNWGRDHEPQIIAPHPRVNASNADTVGEPQDRPPVFQGQRTAASNPFTDSSGRYQGPVKTKTSYPPDPYEGQDSCPECGQHFMQGHAPGCSRASKWGSKMPQAGKYTKDDFAIQDGKKPWERETTTEAEPETASESAYTAAVLAAAGIKQADGRHRMPNLPGKHEPGPDYDPRVPAEGYQVQDASEWLRTHPKDFEAKVLQAFRKGAPFADYSDFDDCTSKNKDKGDADAYCGEIKHRTEDKKGSYESRVLQAAGWAGDVQTPPDDRHNQLWQQHYQKHLDSGMLPDLARDRANQSIEHVKSRGWLGVPGADANPMPKPDMSKRIVDHLHRNVISSFEARVLKAWGETEAPAAVDTLREEGSAPEDDNNDFYHYVEPPKELQTPDLSEAAQIDREQDQQGFDTDGAPGPYSQDMPGAGNLPGGEQQPQQQYMELKIPIPAQGQAGAPGASAIPMQPYQAQPQPPVAPPQQIAASTLAYFDRYFGREVNLQTLENGHAAFTKSRNPMKGTANMARSTLAERGKVVTAGRRQHFAEGPLVDSGDQSRNDQGEQEEVFISQTPPAEQVDAPTDDTPNISNTENNLVAKVQRGRQQLLRDAQALANYRRKHAGDQDEAGGPVATEVNPTVNTGPAGEELTGDDFESADPNADVVETQPKDASLHAFKNFDRWLAKKTGKPSRLHTSATIRRAADDYSRAAGISVQAMFPALGIVLGEVRKNEKKANTKGAKMRKRADEKLEVAAPDGRIDVEAPTEDTTDEEAQASQFSLNDFGNNAGDNIADPDLSTDQNWAPGEAKTSKVKTAGGILAFRCAEAMQAAGLEPNTVERKYQLAGRFENMNRGLVQTATELCERFAAVLQAERRKVASGSTRGAALQSPVPAGLTQGAQRTAATQRLAANDPRNDSTLFV